MLRQRIVAGMFTGERLWDQYPWKRTKELSFDEVKVHPRRSMELGWSFRVSILRQQGCKDQLLEVIASRAGCDLCRGGS